MVITMKISLLQVKQNALYSFGNSAHISPNIRQSLSEKMVRKTLIMADKAAKDGCDYIITPEAVNFTGVPMDEETFNIVEPFGGISFERFSELAKRYNVNILAGLYNMRGGDVYNSAVMFNRDGEIERVYDKVNLAGDENHMIRKGKEYVIIDTEHGRIAPLICWDMQCGAVEEVTKMGADIVFCPTWGWENSYGIECAMKNNIYIAAAMGIPYNGDITGVRTPSEILDRNGKVLAVGSASEECIITHELQIA